MAALDRRDGSRSLDTRREPSGRGDADRARRDTLTLEFPSGNDFHRQQIAEPQNIGLLRDALYEVTGKRLTVVLEAGDTEAAADDEDDEPKSEEDWISSLKETFDAREVDETQ